MARTRRGRIRERARSFDREGCAIGFPSILSFAHQLVRERLRPGDIAVDATMGNGHDTLFLATLVGDGGRVFAFDVQEAALRATRERLDAAGIPAARCALLLRDHAELLEALEAPQAVEGAVIGTRDDDATGSRASRGMPSGAHADGAAAAGRYAGRVGAVMFNLGYLPGGDHTLVTRTASTLRALDAALEALRAGGVLTAVVYPGHEGGAEEAEAVNAWASALPQERYQALTYRFANQRNTPPYVVAVEKRNAAK